MFTFNNPQVQWLLTVAFLFLKCIYYFMYFCMHCSVMYVCPCGCMYTCRYVQACTCGSQRFFFLETGLWPHWSLPVATTDQISQSQELSCLHLPSSKVAALHCIASHKGSGDSAYVDTFMYNKSWTDWISSPGCSHDFLKLVLQLNLGKG